MITASKQPKIKVNEENQYIVDKGDMVYLCKATDLDVSELKMGMKNLVKVDWVVANKEIKNEN